MADNVPGNVSVLFICLGNYCRSPMAEAVFRHMTESHENKPTVDSAGTGAYHAGDPPDPRTMQILDDNSITGYYHVGRKIRPSDFSSFDYILAMDDENLSDLQRMKRQQLKKDIGTDGDGLAKVMLFGDFGGTKGEIVIDPYYGADDGFSIAYDQMKRFSQGFIAQVLDRKESP